MLFLSTTAMEHRLTRPALQIHAWMKRFDLNRSGALEREELFALLSHLHPENPPNGKALDLLIEKVPAEPPPPCMPTLAQPRHPELLERRLLCSHACK